MNIPQVNELISKGIKVIDPQTTYIDQSVKITGKGTVIHPNTFLKGNTEIKEKCEIGPNSFLNNGNSSMFATKTDGTLWSWGSMSYGGLGLNQGDSFLRRSSPTQIPGTTWNYVAGGGPVGAATKTDGTLWSWGYNSTGVLGQNSRTYYSSPVQIPGTSWSERPWVMQEPGGTYFLLGLKT